MSLAPRNRWKLVRELRAELDVEAVQGEYDPFMEGWTDHELKELRECVDDVRLGLRTLEELYETCGLARP